MSVLRLALQCIIQCVYGVGRAGREVNSVMIYHDRKHNDLQVL